MSLRRDLANEIAQGLERLSLEADAARISAETAEAACLAARQELADCEEREAAGRGAIGRCCRPTSRRTSCPSRSARGPRPWVERIAAHLPTAPRRPAGDGRDGRCPGRGRGRRATQVAAGDVRPGRRDPRRQHRGGHPASSPRTTRSGGRSPWSRTARSPRRCRRSAIGSTAWAGGSMTASRHSATCRWRWATPDSTRCGCATGRTKARWPSSTATSRWRLPSTCPGRPAT